MFVQLFPSPQEYNKVVCILVGECYEVAIGHIENLVQILDYREDIRISILTEEKEVFSCGTNIPSTVMFYVPEP